ncbi:MULTISPECIES: multicopper oxidase domain-containing protein [unclassified Actinomyces]|uniref:multicopper oxidase domain-containing protein n=1 Tax=unclassified Actinomyces TaxID=2609248 RepID=UPI002016CFAE|nr:MULTISPECIES: multicopper oxidase domain-containing protein [unclassified Actinomyces]MCL3778524.1 multicopper oxidase domain-containing protein [Actinomyces sp. AC-20-1]MCL3790768.1 multicopper oxidase domain-containing protein [Actinomyces sp. 187325]MCL3793093.1 multicopper oxidase domain-containing protein [Actinomyces sp. 186855]MCL3795495.1 multicopper oxidase domain-containing protein [Actinomyces sp. 217892]
MSDTTGPSQAGGPTGAHGATPRPSPRPAAPRADVTAGTAPSVAAAQRTDAAQAQGPRPTDRRGALLGLVTAGAAVVVGSVAANRAPAPSTTGTTGTVTATGRTVEVTVSVNGMRFVPDTIDVAAGDRLLLTLDNTSDQVHDLVLATGASTGRVAAGASTTLDAGVITGATEGWCSIAGHRAQGMVLHVTTDGAGGAHHHASGGSASAAVDLQAPLPEGFEPFDAALAPAPAVTTHRHTFTVTEVDGAYVGAGVTQTRWTFNGTYPGPVLRGRVGDVFEITLVNEGTMSHSIDFHAGIVPPDDVMRSINPGESLVYTFTAAHAGIWLYHCSTAPMSVHLASGMHGAVIIDPDGLAPVDREYVLIQSEIYLGPEGGDTDADKVAAKTPDLMCFNGVAFQYALAPLEARSGERVRLWVLDAGPSLACSFHVVGLQLDTVFLEGAYMLGGPDELGRTWGGGSQALGLHPAQGGFVEAVVPAAGHYPMVTHAFADMEKGAKAVLKVTD